MRVDSDTIYQGLCNFLTGGVTGSINEEEL